MVIVVPGWFCWTVLCVLAAPVVALTLSALGSAVSWAGRELAAEDRRMKEKAKSTPPLTLAQTVFGHSFVALSIGGFLLLLLYR